MDRVYLGVLHYSTSHELLLKVKYESRFSIMFYKNEAHAHLTKPMNFEDLWRTVDNLLA